MAPRRSRLAAAVLGVAAGAGASLPVMPCAGGACSSCLACVGVGGAAACALLVGAVLRVVGRRALARNRPTYGDGDPVLTPQPPTIEEAAS